MTITDYLLLAGFMAACIYVVYRLFAGWRNSVAPHISTDSNPESVRPVRPGGGIN